MPSDWMMMKRLPVFVRSFGLIHAAVKPVDVSNKHAIAILVAENRGRMEPIILNEHRSGFNCQV